ncbi:ankyrin repeat domain-containing protein [Solimonas sp. SE-A11]|uniref:ankyrin repeat domain-containing protein n=1 Tax=Solimonas sp. SE-A11 TaxID=3054954 RepID=UPI00259C8513|nr:ankyrin repeat domain-containing protein [Solimonas sp. SE-A11]MDM4771043.1 ankyrin repeat domain-containing protein [Solimonas sp. SE-A11]
MGAKLFRIVIPVSGLDRAVRFYSSLLLVDGFRVPPAIHNFPLGQALLTCYDARVDGETPLPPSPQLIYIGVDENLMQLRMRAVQMGATEVDHEPRRMPGGEAGLCMTDPWGNRLAMVDAHTMQWGAPVPAFRSKEVVAAPQQGVLLLRQDFLNAVKGGEFSRMKELLALDHDLIDTVDGTGASVLLVAAYKRQERIAAYLLALRDDLTLCEAAAMGAIEPLALLLRRAPERVNLPGADGFLPLGLACFFGHGDCVDRLLQAGADVNAVSRNNMRSHPLNSALTQTSQECALGIVHRLLRAGAQPNAAQVSGHTALHQAAGRGFLEAVDVLLQAGADPGLRADNGATPAMLAQRAGHAAVLERLRRHGDGRRPPVDPFAETMMF